MAANTLDIGALQTASAGANSMDIGALQAVPAVPSGGQVIMITRILLPIFWLKQGKQKRRDFIKNTILALAGR